ncbi:MAG: SH3 domain-containing protein [Acidimicrobiales bacterium]
MTAIPARYPRSATGVRLGALGVALAVALAACGSSTPHAAQATHGTTLRTTTTQASATTLPPVSTTVPGIQTSGQRTVLIPVGLNVRAQPSPSAKVLGTAAQGVVLNVLGHSTQAGGWYQVKGATVTGWISDSAVLSAPGTFHSYSSAQFGVLYPSTWTYTQTSPSIVTFRSQTAGDTVVVTTATTVSQLGLGRPGYAQSQSEVVVACGITTDLYTYTETASSATTTTTTAATAAPTGTATTIATSGAGAGRYLAQVRLTLHPHHALGLDASLGDLSELQTVRDFVYSLTFPFPPCQG